MPVLLAWCGNGSSGHGGGTTTGGVGDGATTAGSEDAPSSSEAASAVLSSLQQQIAAASETGGSGAPQGVSAEVLTEKLGTLQASASTTAFEAQQAAADIFNDGDPASAEALQGLSPNQAVLMLQAARVWLRIRKIPVELIPSGIFGRGSCCFVLAGVARRAAPEVHLCAWHRGGREGRTHREGWRRCWRRRR